MLKSEAIYKADKICIYFTFIYIHIYNTHIINCDNIVFLTLPALKINGGWLQW